MTNLSKEQRHHIDNKGTYYYSYGFSQLQYREITLNFDAVEN